MHRLGKSALALLVGLALTATGKSQPLVESVPSATHLLPADTLAYARIRSLAQWRTSTRESSIRRMFRDPRLAPAIKDGWERINRAFTPIEEQLGLNLDQLIELGQGQFAVAVVPSQLSAEKIARLEELQGDESETAFRERLKLKRERNQGFAGVILLDAGDRIGDLKTLAESLELILADRGFTNQLIEDDAIAIQRLTLRNSRYPPIEYGFKGNTLLVGIGTGIASDILHRWRDGDRSSTLAGQQRFASVLSRCLGEEDDEPMMTFYADVQGLAAQATGQIKPLGVVWPIIQNLGFEKIQGLGGSVFLGGETFQSAMHVHLAIDPPRDGLLSILNPVSNRSIPPAWVPEDVGNYSSWNWDFEKTYHDIVDLMGEFGMDKPAEQGEQRMTERLGINFREELKLTLGNRYVAVSWVEPPLKLNSKVKIHALSLKDTTRAKDVAEKLREKFPTQLTVDDVGGQVVYRIKPRRQLGEGYRPHSPAFALVDGWLLLSESSPFLERALMANAKQLPRLRNDLQYELTFSELGEKLGGEKPFFVSFTKNAKSIQWIYDSLRSKRSQRAIKRQLRFLGLADEFDQWVKTNSLPDFEAFEDYFGCSCMYAYDEPGGIHLGSFTLQESP